MSVVAPKEAPCRVCGEAFLAPLRKVLKGNWICVTCERKYDAARRARLAAEGRTCRGKRTPERRKAWAADPEILRRNATRVRTRYAIKHGILTPQPCERCGAAKVEAHHSDYSDHLNVNWFCPACHRQHHLEERRARGEQS